MSGKNELFARAQALLHLNTIPGRFGLILVEANGAGVPVIAMNLGSCLEVQKYPTLEKAGEQIQADPEGA